MTVPPEAVTAIAKTLSVHRWKSMGVASVECECGAILFGPENLTQFPADEAFRRHLAEALLTDTAPSLRAEDAAAERDHVRAFAEGLVQPEHQYVRRELLKLLDGAP